MRAPLGIGEQTAFVKVLTESRKAISELREFPLLEGDCVAIGDLIDQISDAFFDEIRPHADEGMASHEEALLRAMKFVRDILLDTDEVVHTGSGAEMMRKRNTSYASNTLAHEYASYRRACKEEAGKISMDFSLGW